MIVRPKVSVIIPFYNNKEWLRESINSVLSQTFQNFEIILVDDGSSEDISDILQCYGNRIKYVRQENAGPGAARNNGIKHAKGDLIAFCDSDDIWLPDKLRKQILFMEESGAKWCHTGFYNWWPKTGKTVEVNTSRDYDNIFLQTMVSTKIATPSVMILKELFDSGNFYFREDIKNGEDGELYRRLSHNFKLALVEEPLVKVRMRGNNSKGKAIERFHLRKFVYSKWKNEGLKLPLMIHLIYSFYSFYSLVFPKKTNRRVNVIAKCFWAIPYVIERVYVRWLFYRSDKSEAYIQRYSKEKSADIEQVPPPNMSL